MQSTPTTSQREVKMGTTKTNQSVPSPRPLSISTSTNISISTTSNSSRPARRLSLNIPNPGFRSNPIPVPTAGPVPTRHGSISYSHSHSYRQQHRMSSGSGSNVERRFGSSLSLSLGQGAMESKRMDDDEWLDISLEVIEPEQGLIQVKGDDGMEKAVEVLLQSGKDCVLVNLDSAKGEYAFFDFSDLNVFLLLVLQAASASPDIGTRDDRKGQVIRLLRAGGKVPVSSVCNISGKNPYYQFTPTSTLRYLAPLFASGIHWILLTSPTSPKILTASNVLEHLVATRPPSFFEQTFLSPSLDIPLNPLVSLSGMDSILDAMQIMSLNNLSALGVVDQSVTSIAYQGHRRGSSSSGSSGGIGIAREKRSGSSSFYKSQSPGSSQVFTISPQILPSPGAELPSPFDGPGGGGELMNVITAEGCARLVVPSQGKEALGMGLGEATKVLQQVEFAGQERGEERVPVHTITCHSSILHASHLLLATASSRIFLRTPTGLGVSPGISPTIPSPPSPTISISSLSLLDTSSDPKSGLEGKGKGNGLPVPPATTFSPHYVVSITDIFSALVKAYSHSMNGSGPDSASKEGVTVEQKDKVDKVHISVLDASPVGEGGVERTGGLGLESWKWAKGQSAGKE